MPNPSGTTNPPKKAVSFVKGPSSATLAQTRSHTRGATLARTQPKIAALREVQSEDEEPYKEDELEDFVNLPTDSEPDDLGDLNSEDYDDIDPEQ